MEDPPSTNTSEPDPQRRVLEVLSLSMLRNFYLLSKQTG